MERDSELLDACESGDLERFNFLIEMDPSLSHREYDEMGNKISPLVGACCCGQAEMVIELLRQGVPVDIEDDEGDTPLQYAIMWSKYHIVNILINHGADINKQNKSGFTALHQACYDANLEIVKMLLEAGADVMIKDQNEHLPKEVSTINSIYEERVAIYNLLEAYENAVDIKEPID